MLNQSWEFFLTKVRSRHHDRLLDEIIKVMGEGPLAYAVNRGGTDRKGLSNHFQNNSPKDSLVFIATTIRYLAQTMDKAEIKAWFLASREEFDGFTVNDMIRDGYREQIIAIAEKSETGVAQSA